MGVREDRDVGAEKSSSASPIRVRSFRLSLGDNPINLARKLATEIVEVVGLVFMLRSLFLCTMQRAQLAHRFHQDGKQPRIALALLGLLIDTHAAFDIADLSLGGAPEPVHQRDPPAGERLAALAHHDAAARDGGKSPLSGGIDRSAVEPKIERAETHLGLGKDLRHRRALAVSLADERNYLFRGCGHELTSSRQRCVKKRRE